MKISAVSILISFYDHHALISAATDLFIEPLTWNDANNYCTSKGHNLIAIDRLAKQRYLQETILEKNLGRTEFWIGLHVPDANQLNIRAWTNTCSMPTNYSKWSPSLKTGPKELCTFVKVESDNMYWFLDACDKATKPFICESTFSVFCFVSSFDTEGDSTVPTGSNGQITEKDPGTEFECGIHCYFDPQCWGFTFTPSVPKCVMHDRIDDPFYLDNNKVDSLGDTLFMKRCYFEINVDTNVYSVPPYDDCGSDVVSKCVSCVAAIEETTTQKQTSTFEVSSAEKTTESTAPPTESRGTSTVELTSSALTETTSIAKTEHFSTAQKEFTTINTGKTPYCVCTCNNETKQISLEESINEIVNDIKIDRLKTSSYTRKHTSARDSRKSSANIGYVGIAILISIAFLLVCLDCSSLILRVIVMIRKLGTSHNENGK